MKTAPLLLLFAFALHWRPHQGPALKTYPTGGIDTVAVRGVLRAVNALRATGCRCPNGQVFDPAPPLRVDGRLVRAAQSHAEDMQQRDYFSHSTPEGVDPGDRALRAGYRWSLIAENIAWGYPTPESVVEGWQHSAGHCSNMLGHTFRHIGVGRSGTHWVLLVGAPYGGKP